MGVVYKARHTGLKRLVALKMILTGQMATADERERFLREAELAANLDHPNIVPIFEVSEFQGCPFFSMKLVEGESLARQIKAKRKQRCPPRPQRGRFSAGDDRPRRPLRPRTRLPPLRPEAVEYPARSRGPALRHRLWPGQAGERGQRAVDQRRDPGNAQLHGPRAGLRLAARLAPDDRCLRAGRDLL